MVTGTLTATEKRLLVVKKYEVILGRNNYSQSLRDYCYKKHKNGKYYSDCSSSISYAYKEAGFSFGILNTVGMYNSSKFIDVPVVIKNGVIQNPEVLRLGDMLLFAGKDSSRASAGYVGHVEMVYKINGKIVTLCGHGSGTPRTTEMNAYCRSRYNSKTSTKLGHRGLIRVRRFIVDDGEGGLCIYNGCKGSEVTALQEKLDKLNKQGFIDVGLGKYGIDGDFGSDTEKAVEAFQSKYGLETTGIVDDATMKKIDDVLNGNTATTKPEEEKPEIILVKNAITVKSGLWNLRTGPGKEYASAGTVKSGTILEEVDPDNWIPVKSEDGKKVLWISKNAVQE